MPDEICSSCGDIFPSGFVGDRCKICYHESGVKYERWFCDRCEDLYYKHIAICRIANFNRGDIPNVLDKGSVRH